MGTGTGSTPEARPGAAAPEPVVVSLIPADGPAAGSRLPRAPRHRRFVLPVVAVVLAAGLVVAAIGWIRVSARAGGIERDLEIAEAGLTLLRSERDQAVADAAEMAVRLEAAEEEAGAAGGPLLEEIDRLEAENLLLRKAVVVSSASPGGTRVGLTFDGDPDPGALTATLDALAAEGVTATFFPSGRALEADPDGWAQAVREGHELGSTTYARSPLDPGDPEASVAAIQAWGEAARDVAGDGFRAFWFRPPTPAGFEDLVGAAGLRDVLAEQGLVTALWSVETWYALYSPAGPQAAGPDPDAAAVARYVAGEAEGGAIILLQFGTPDVAAVPAILDGLRDAGWEPGTLTELFEAQEEVLEGPVGAGS